MDIKLASVVLGFKYLKPFILKLSLTKIFFFFFFLPSPNLPCCLWTHATGSVQQALIISVSTLSHCGFRHCENMKEV